MARCARRGVDRRAVLLGSVGLLVGAATVAAADAAPVLTVRGAIAHAGPDGSRAFTLAELKAMPQKSFRTATPWHRQSMLFRGIAVADLLAVVGARGSRLRLIALNDYAVIADIAELTTHGALLALSKDGVALPVSDKGPIFVVFPFDSDSKLRTDNFYLHSVWQLCQIDVL